jgi:serine/threonine protein kinase
MVGRTIGHYQILEKAGQGGMGVVYKARDTRLERFVAIKVLPPERVANPERKRRFIQEARAASALNHPNIITVHDIGCEADVDFIVTEFIAGKTLDQYALPLPRGRMLPQISAGGFRSAVEMAKIPGALRIDGEAAPGPASGTYAFTRATVQRNLFRIPVP